MALVRRALTLFALALAAVCLFAGGWLTGRLGIGTVVAPASLPQAELEFADRMRNVSMVGTFTTDGRASRSAEPDRYDITSVEKVGDDLWRFNTRMACCGVENSVLPIVVPMKWIGDTPVIMMTETSLPGLGTFTVRVFFYSDRYSGTWQHGKTGGHMSGRIEKHASPPPQ
jgi:hypothetical protein